MKAHQRFTYIFIIFFLIGGCKTLEKKATEKKLLIRTKIVLKLLFHVEKIAILKSISTRGGLLNKNTQKKKFVHGKQLLPQKIAI